jgi:hypothetical protein
MDNQIIFVYCLCGDLLKVLEHHEDPQCRVSDAEILITALGAALYLGGHFRRAQEFLHEQGYLPRKLSSSRFVRRVHRCADFLLPLFHGLAKLGYQLNPESVYVIDSFPLSVCDNIRIRRCRRYQGEAWRGYQASKQRYFYSLKVHQLEQAHVAGLHPVREVFPTEKKKGRCMGPTATRNRLPVSEALAKLWVTR